MSTIDDLLARRQIVWGAADESCKHAAAANRRMTEREQAKYESASAELEALDARIEQLKGEERRAQQSARVMDSLRGARPSSTDAVWLPGLAEYRDLVAEQRAIGTAGAFIPQAAAAVYFDLLRKRTAVLAAGPVILPVEGSGSVKVPSVTSSVVVAGVAENTAIAPADPGLGEIVLDPRKFGALTLVAREAIEDSRPELRQVVANSLVRDVAVELDRQLVTGSGVAPNLRGLRNTTGATAGPATGANGASLTYNILADTMAAAENANVDLDRLAWIMHSRSWGSVRKLASTAGEPLFTQTSDGEDARRSLFGVPVHISNALPINEVVGTSTDTTALILVDVSQVVVAVSRAVELSISTDFAFNTDQVAVRVTCRYDIGVPQPTALTVTTGVRP
ncbi:MAG: phage major capsid protein [Haloechinothrix sp.]